MADHIAVSGCVLVDASCAAPARLGMLARDGMLLRASELAYGDGITGLVQAAGPAAGLTRLAGVCLGNLAETDDRAHLALQWQAIAADGKLFTALDADLMLVTMAPATKPSAKAARKLPRFIGSHSPRLLAVLMTGPAHELGRFLHATRGARIWHPPGIRVSS